MVLRRDKDHPRCKKSHSGRPRPEQLPTFRRAASRGALAPESPRATRRQQEFIRTRIRMKPHFCPGKIGLSRLNPIFWSTPFFFRSPRKAYTVFPGKPTLPRIPLPFTTLAQPEFSEKQGVLREHHSMTLPYLHRPHHSGPIQWARGDVGLKPSAAARPWTLADCEWRAAAPGQNPLWLPRAHIVW